MAANLFSIVMQSLTPGVIARIASALGIDQSLAQKAIGGAVPTLLTGLADISSTPSGARQLSNAAAQQPGPLDSLKGLLEGGDQSAITGAGSNMLAGLFGGGAFDTLTATIGKFTGLSNGTTKALLGMLAPVVLGTLGQQQRSAGLDAGGLASMLGAQKDQLAAAIPSGLADKLSAAGLIDKADAGLRAGAAAASGATARVTTAADRAMDAGRSGIGATNWSYIAGALALLAVLGWFYLGRPGTETVADAQKTTTPSSASGTVGLAPSSVTVGGVNLANEINSSVNSLKSVLPTITDAASARAALPTIRQASSQLNDVSSLIAKLPPEGRTALVKVIAVAMPTIDQLCDKVLATPGVGDIAKPEIDQLKGQLDNLSKV
jgi:uncharacterized protein DUF937